MSDPSCPEAIVHRARPASAADTTFPAPTTPSFPPSGASPRLAKTPVTALTREDRKRSSPVVAAAASSLPTAESPPPAGDSPSKRQKQDGAPSPHLLPRVYAACPTTHLCTLISSLLLELVSLNDNIPLSNTGLTRFHSRAPPAISIPDYLNRLSIHASLQPSILLAMVYYIDILSTHYPPFVVSSLTVHRFLITAATVASKGLCDTFLTNGLYARIGGVSLMELNMLELEFLVRVGWRIVPKHEVLEEYYGSLVERGGDGYLLDGPPPPAEDDEEDDTAASGAEV